MFFSKLVSLALDLLSEGPTAEEFKAIHEQNLAFAAALVQVIGAPRNLAVNTPENRLTALENMLKEPKVDGYFRGLQTGQDVLRSLVGILNTDRTVRDQIPGSFDPRTIGARTLKSHKIVIPEQQYWQPRFSGAIAAAAIIEQAKNLKPA